MYNKPLVLTVSKLVGWGCRYVYIKHNHFSLRILITPPIGYVPPSWGHYIENTGNETLVYLEIFNSSA